MLFDTAEAEELASLAYGRIGIFGHRIVSPQGLE